MGVCNFSMFCCTLLYVHSSIAIILIGKRELIALLNLSSWCLVMVERLFLAVPQGCLQFVIVVFPDHTHLLFTITEDFTALKQRNSVSSFSGSAHTLCPKHYSLPTNYSSASLQPLQIVYLNPNELRLCRQVPFQWLNDCMTEKQKMYVPRSRSSLAG